MHKVSFTVLVYAVSIYLLFLSLLNMTRIGEAESGRWVGLVAQSQMGNQLWALASAYGIARARNARLCVMTGPDHRFPVYSSYIQWTVDQPTECPGIVFLTSYFWYTSLFTPVSDDGYYAAYSENYLNAPEAMIRVDGCLQSFRYFDKDVPVPFRLRKARAAQRWISERGITAAIHIRRGDKVYDLGNVVPPLHYFRLAISRLRSLHPRQEQRFVVSSDDPGWVRASPVFSGMEVLSSDDPSFDMAVISECQHKIISIGTFGWWGAFLNDRGSNQTSSVIYPLPQMEYMKEWGFNNSDYFPPHWTSIEYRLFPESDV
jgi:galactoside 2-L-fucosyltransferase 1/2